MTKEDTGLDNVHLNNLAQYKADLEGATRVEAKELLKEAHAEAQELSAWAEELASQLDEASENLENLRDILTEVDWEA